MGPKGSPERQRLVIQRVEVNPPLDDARFAMPAAPSRRPAAGEAQGPRCATLTPRRRVVREVLHGLVDLGSRRSRPARRRGRPPRAASSPSSSASARSWSGALRPSAGTGRPGRSGSSSRSSPSSRWPSSASPSCGASACRAAKPVDRMEGERALVHRGRGPGRRGQGRDARHVVERAHRRRRGAREGPPLPGGAGRGADPLAAGRVGKREAATCRDSVARSSSSSFSRCSSSTSSPRRRSWSPSRTPSWWSGSAASRASSTRASTSWCPSWT